MSPELPEREIRRVIRERIREGLLRTIAPPVPAATASAGGSSCMVCGFSISADRAECDMAGARAHERCAEIWCEESNSQLA
jgi:hypothetical protein